MNIDLNFVLKMIHISIGHLQSEIECFWSAVWKKCDCPTLMTPRSPLVYEFPYDICHKKTSAINWNLYAPWRTLNFIRYHLWKHLLTSCLELIWANRSHSKSTRFLVVVLSIFRIYKKCRQSQICNWTSLILSRLFMHNKILYTT